MYMNEKDDRGDAAMNEAYTASRAARVERARAALGKPTPTAIQPAIVGDFRRQRKPRNWNNIIGTIIAIPLVGGVAVLLFGFMVWAATWVWSHV